MSVRAISTHHFTGRAPPSKVLAVLTPWTWDVPWGIPFLGQAIRVSKLVSLGRCALASSAPHNFSTPHPIFLPPPSPHNLEVCRPSPGVRVPGGSEVTLRMMTLSSTVPFSGPQLSQRTVIRAKVFYSQAPPLTTLSAWPIFIAASGAGKGRSPRHTLPPTPIAVLLLLWRKGQDSGSLTGMPLSGAQRHLSQPEPQLERAEPLYGGFPFTPRAGRGIVP